jgi:hypothetical protein
VFLILLKILMLRFHIGVGWRWQGICLLGTYTASNFRANAANGYLGRERGRRLHI